MKRGPKRSLNALLFLYLLAILGIAGLLTGTSYMIFFPLGYIFSWIFSPIGIILLLIFFTTMLFASFGRSKLRPMDDLINAMSQVSKGDFSVRVNEDEAPGDMGEVFHSFNDMAQELGSIEMFRKDFINNFSHEFKTPIVSIRGFAKQLERDDLTDEQRREYTEIIVNESERLANMSSNILLLTKLENQQIVTDKEDYSLDEQLRDSILLLEKRWTEKNLDMNINLDSVTFYGNREMVSHIWINLIGNAIKFSPENGEMEISCAERDGSAVVTVRDHGAGMNEATRTRIFEKFYQGDSSHASEGNGLGLSLVKRIVDLCAGKITVESEIGAGTAFTVTLPNERNKSA